MINRPTDHVKIETVELEKIRLGIRQSMSEDMLYYVDDINVELERMARTIEIYLRGYVYAEKESLKRQVVKYPQDWWQAVKERFFPQSLLKKYPVRYKIIELDVRAIYPDIKFKLPDRSPRLIIQRTDISDFTEANR